MPARPKERPTFLARLRDRVASAIAHRRAFDLGPDTDVLRLVHDAADELPGLVVDAYGPVARVEMYDRRYREGLLDIAEEIRALWPGIEAVVGLERKERGQAEVIPVLGTTPLGHVVHEEGWRFFVRTREPEAAGTGIFVDQREGRRLVRQAARGRPVLNLFAHAGAFGVAALAGDARRIDHVDAAKKCAPWAALNLALNGGDPREHRFLVDDAFKILRRVARREPAYGVVVCDPPTTAIAPGGKRFVARDALPSLAEQSCRALLEGGALLLSTNDRSLTVDDMAAAAEEGAHRAGRKVASLVEVPLGPDLPPHEDPRVRPMRGVWMRLDARDAHHTAGAARFEGEQGGVEC